MKKRKMIWICNLVITVFIAFGISPSAYAITYDKVSVGGIPSASTWYDSSTMADKAFDSSASTCWMSANYMYSMPPQFLRYQLTAPRVVTKYRIQSYPGAYFAPKNWQFQGSNNGGSWYTLDSRNNQINWGANEWREFTVNTGTPFLYFRLYVTATNNQGSLYRVAISEFELYSPTLPTVTISANPTTINGGSSSTLSWSATNVTQVSISPGVGVVFSSSLITEYASGTRVVWPNVTTNYAITANPPGGGTANATVTVIYEHDYDFIYDSNGNLVGMQERE